MHCSHLAVSPSLPTTDSHRIVVEAVVLLAVEDTISEVAAYEPGHCTFKRSMSFVESYELPTITVFQAMPH